MSEKKESWLDPELADELAETAQTFARLGATLAGLPRTLLPPEKRRQAQQLSNELLRLGAAVPRTLGVMLEETDGQQGKRRQREDLGSRLRRQQRAANEADATAPPGESDPAE